MMELMNKTEEHCFSAIRNEEEVLNRSFNEQIEILQEFSGCSNDNYLVSVNGKLFVLRRYTHRDDLIMRDQQREIEILCYLQDHGCRVVSRQLLNFGTFFLIEYIDGTLLESDKDLAIPIHNIEIAKALRHLHSFKMNSLKNDLPTVEAIMLESSDYFGTDRYTLELVTEYLLEEIRRLSDQHLSMLFTCITHNDAHSGNIVFSPDGPSFIDFEYASCNYNFYDICCYFAEFTGIDVVMDDLATVPQKIEFYKAYFGADVDCELCEEMLSLFEVFTWGVWSLWGKEAGYQIYAERRLNIFRAHYEHVLHRLTSVE